MTYCGKKLLRIFLVILIISLGSCSNDERNQEQINTDGENLVSAENTEAELNKHIEENRYLQPERKEFIDNLLDSGLASRVENPTGKPYIYVTEPFYLLSKSEQASIMNVVWHYYVTEDGNVDVLTIYDHNTGNEIGTFGRKGLLIVE